ncbi:hypothetical protein DAMA08_020460 [Martiniozyma asiatica (nom. inval.)]|nr:hypothetical protein DAMA08_020460 [Martiniozyma asiatica]
MDTLTFLKPEVVTVRSVVEFKGQIADKMIEDSEDTVKSNKKAIRAYHVIHRVDKAAAVACVYDDPRNIEQSFAGQWEHIASTRRGV